MRHGCCLVLLVLHRAVKVGQLKLTFYQHVYTRDLCSAIIFRGIALLGFLPKNFELFSITEVVSDIVPPAVTLNKYSGPSLAFYLIPS